MWCDAHNHLQDARFAGRQTALLAEARAAGVTALVVNGACEADWDDVAALAAADVAVRPAYGWHPWYLHERRPGWLERLRVRLEGDPTASVGEIGLDRWLGEQPSEIRGRYVPELAHTAVASLAEQEEAFVGQWELAVALDRPVTVHCLRAWGPLLALLRRLPRAPRGFLLHSYGGSAELVAELAEFGAFFGFPGYFLQPRKERQRAVFRNVPRERLVVETDAPDQLPPEDLAHVRFVAGADGRTLNHPANVVAIGEALAAYLGEEPETLARSTTAAWARLFGP